MHYVKVMPFEHISLISQIKHTHKTQETLLTEYNLSFTLTKTFHVA